MSFCEEVFATVPFATSPGDNISLTDAVYFGNVKPDVVYFESQEADKIYYGPDLVYEK
jgi:hypothetical protein